MRAKVAAAPANRCTLRLDLQAGIAGTEAEQALQWPC